MAHKGNNWEDLADIVKRHYDITPGKANVRIPIPTWLILGDAEIIEKAISENMFHIDFKMIHPLLGKTFSYSGTFYIADATH